jgi:ubiquinone/menaquinone biosynthesis C-methylase UbiE
MPSTNATSHPASPGPASRANEIITAISMTIGRGPRARATAAAARLTPADRVIDIGCGPGTAVRLAARRADAATGIDPSPVMLQLARQISRIRHARHVSWAEGKAEKLPVPDGQATVAWAISSVHHWDDRAAGLSEARRALVPGGRLVLAERLAREQARGHAAHGLTSGQAEDLARQLTAAGFLRVQAQTCKAGHRRLVIVRGETSTAT